MVTEQAVLDGLAAVKDPEQPQDIAWLGLMRALTIADSQVNLTLASTTQSPASKATMHSMASRAVGRVPGVSKVQVKMGGLPSARPAQPAAHAHAPGPERSADFIPEVKHTIAVSSGEGGDGKSTASVNLTE